MPTPKLHADLTAQQALAEAHRLSESGDLAGARQLYQALVDQPELTATCLYRLGLIAGTTGDHRRAAALTRQATRLQPNLWEAYPVWSAALRRLGETGGAIAALLEFGGVLDQAGEGARAVEVFQQVMQRDPLNYPAWANAGRCLAWLGQPREAAPYLAQALRLCGRERAAVASLLRRIETRVSGRLILDGSALPEGSPHGVESVERVLATLGKVLSDEYFIEEAVSCQRLATWLAPGYALAHWNLAQALLVQGDWHDGWREYEWRWQWPESPEPPKQVPVPPWQGQSVKGKRVLVWTEQGYGDAIQFLPLVNKLRVLGATVILETPYPLKRLFAASLPDLEVVDRPERPDLLATDEQLDFIVPLMSLPQRFDLSPKDLPLAEGYLSLPQEMIKAWAARLAPRPSPRVGLVWDGRTNHLPFDTCRALFDVPGVSWCSLQLGPEQARLQDLTSESVMDCSLWLDDFAETAAAIQQLDLVITIDTAIAHLAGALGKPVWAMLNHAPNWRWRGTTDRCTWYPSMRLFRRRLDQPWEESVATVRQSLEKWIPTAAASKPRRRRSGTADVSRDTGS